MVVYRMITCGLGMAQKNDNSTHNVSSIHNLATVIERPFIELTEEISPEPDPSLESFLVDMSKEKDITRLLSRLKDFRKDPFLKTKFGIIPNSSIPDLPNRIATTVKSIQEVDKDFTFDITTTNLEPVQAYLLLRLLLDNLDVLSKDGQPGRSPVFASRFKFKNPDKVIHIPPRRSHSKMRETISEHIRALLKGGQIRPCESPFSSPVQLISKKDGKIRFCIDFRALNENLVNDVYPIARIDDALSMLGSGSFFSSLDIANAYWHIPLHPDDQLYTAFSSADGLFCWIVLPFGLKNAPAIFARFMDTIMSGLKWRNCLVYFDDILVFSKSFTDHIVDLAQVFARLYKYDVKLKLAKCTFARQEFLYLGHVITPNGLRPNPSLVTAIKEMPLPENAKEIATFLGMCGYYRKFIKNYATHTQPLRDKANRTPFLAFTPEELQAVDYLKSILISDKVMIHHPNYDIPFEIHTDASSKGLGAVLCQRIDNQERVVQYASRAVSKLEGENYSSNDLEALAMVWACDLFRCYVYGQHFILYTDHNNLRTFLKTPDPGRQSRWVFKLSEFDVDIRHRRALLHQNADALSRLPVANTESTSTFSFDTMITDSVPVFVSATNDSSTSVCSWNVNSLRSLIKKDKFFPFLVKLHPHVLCITELRGTATQLWKIPNFVEQLEHLGYHWRYWFPCLHNVGYAGVATICRISPVTITYGVGSVDIDQEGRVLTTQFHNFTVVNSYTPCIGMNHQTLDKRLRFDRKMQQFVSTLQTDKVLWIGDFNVTPHDNDAWDFTFNPQRVNHPATTPVERNSFAEILKETGFRDLFSTKRTMSCNQYTFYPSIRHQYLNKGLRLDMALCSPALITSVIAFTHLPSFVGSDHIPIMVNLDFRQSSTYTEKPCIKHFRCVESPVYTEPDSIKMDFRTKSMYRIKPPGIEQLSLKTLYPKSINNHPAVIDLRDIPSSTEEFDYGFSKSTSVPIKTILKTTPVTETEKTKLTVTFAPALTQHNHGLPNGHPHNPPFHLVDDENVPNGHPPQSPPLREIPPMSPEIPQTPPSPRDIPRFVLVDDETPPGSPVFVMDDFPEEPPVRRANGHGMNGHGINQEDVIPDSPPTPYRDDWYPPEQEPNGVHGYGPERNTRLRHRQQPYRRRSRSPSLRSILNNVTEYTPNLDPSQYSDVSVEQFKECQQHDQGCISIISKMDKLKAFYIIIGGILFKQDKDRPFPHRPYVPVKLRSYYLYYFHGLPITGHPGRRRMYSQLQRYYYWPGMYSDVKRWVKGCVACIKRKTPFHMYSVTPRSTLAHYPMHMLAIDHRGPLKRTKDGYLYLFNVIDVFSRFIWCIPTKTVDAEETSRCLMEIFLRYGFPKVIISDRGSAFISRLFNEFMKITGINHRMTTAYQKQSNTHIERPHRHMNEVLTILMTPTKDNWDRLASILAFSFNIAISDSGYSPFEIIYGRSPRMPLALHTGNLPFYQNQQEYFTDTAKFLKECFAKVRAQQIRQRQIVREYIERKRIPEKFRLNPPSYEKGDIVFLYEPDTADAYVRSGQDMKGIKKLLSKWTGPHMVNRKINLINYEILHSSRRVMEMAHVNRLVPYDPWNKTELELLLNQQSPTPVTVAKNLDQYHPNIDDFEVGSIVAYLVDPPYPKNLPFLIGRILPPRMAHTGILLHWYGQYAKRPKPASKFLPTYEDPKDNKLYYRQSPLHRTHPPWTNENSKTIIEPDKLRGPLHFIKNKDGEEIIGLFDAPSKSLLKHLIRQAKV